MSNDMDINKLLQKSIHAGSIYTLPEDVELSEQQIKSWLAAFLSIFRDDEQDHITQTWWLWREDDENEVRARNGVPNDIEQIKWLFTKKRLTASMFEPKLSLSEITLIKTTREIDSTERAKTDNQFTACDLCSDKTCSTKTCNTIIKLFNRIAREITGGQCSTSQSLFDSAAAIRKTITKMRTQMGNLLHPDLIFQFENGDFINWKSLANGIRRVYDVNQASDTITSVFQSLNEIVKSKKRTEVKVAAFKNFVSRLAIKSETNFIEARDMEEKQVFMNYPEEYNPLINTLFMFMLFRDIPESEWPTIQENFERKIQSGWSYKNWHENRPKLYDVMDKISKPERAKPQIAIVRNSSEERNVKPRYDNPMRSDYTRNEQDLNVPQTQSSHHRNDLYCDREKQRTRDIVTSRDRGRSISPDSFRRNNRDHFHSPNGKLPIQERMEANNQAERSKNNLCIHCTTNNERQIAIYHPPGTGFGGHGSCCVYNIYGDINSQEARGVIQEISESDEPYYLADQNVFKISSRYRACNDNQHPRGNI